MMTRKHYVQFVKIFADNYDAIIHTDGKILEDFCDVFAKDNPRFNKPLFMLTVENRSRENYG